MPRLTGRNEILGMGHKIMGMTNSDVVARWAAQITDPDAEPYYPRRGNILVYPSNPDVIYSYGTHFPMAVIMRDESKTPRWMLVNGDTFSVSTSRHQSDVRAHVQRSGLPALIVPFTALRSANIERASIRPVGIEADTHTVTWYYAATLDAVPSWRVDTAEETDDGRWRYPVERHWLGEATFTAEVTTWEPGEGYRSERRPFLSAFDHQEAQHYFLCELPRDAVSVADAFEALRPAAVLAADASGVEVTRQGDVFAIPTALTTRAVKAMGEHSRMGHVVDSHVATEMVTDGVTTYARGSLWHRPPFGRAPEHRRQRMGDGKTWHLIVRNTVPKDAHGNSRAWSSAGNVD